MSQIPLALLQTPQLFLPGKKPLRSVRLNRQHALSPSLFCGWFGDSPTSLRELVRERTIPKSGTIATSVTTQGPVGQGWESTQRVVFGGHFDLSDYTSTSGSYTLSFYADWPSSDPNPSAASYFFDTGTGRLLLGEGSQAPEDLQMYDGAWTSSNVSIYVGRPALVTVVLNGETGAYLVYIDEVQEYSGSSVYTAQNIGGAVRLFDRYADDAAAHNVTGIPFYYVMIHEGVRSPAQIAAMARNPFGMFLPA